MSHEYTECVYDFALSSISLRPVVSTAEHLAFPDVRRAALRPGRDMIVVLRVELVILRAFGGRQGLVLAHDFPSLGHHPF